jgi:hypothetical protein
MNRWRRVLPPKIALMAIVTMTALHGVVPLAIVVRRPSLTRARFSWGRALP